MQIRSAFLTHQTQKNLTINLDCFFSRLGETHLIAHFTDNLLAIPIYYERRNLERTHLNII